MYWHIWFLLETLKETVPSFRSSICWVLAVPGVSWLVDTSFQSQLLYLHGDSLCLWSFMWPHCLYVCVCVCPNLPFWKNISYWIKVHHDLIYIILIILAETLFPIKDTLTGTGIGLEYIFWGGILQLKTTSLAYHNLSSNIIIQLYM
jgi:hypothetical protein